MCNTHGGRTKKKKKKKTLSHNNMYQHQEKKRKAESSLEEITASSEVVSPPSKLARSCCTRRDTRTFNELKGVSKEGTSFTYRQLLSLWTQAKKREEQKGDDELSRWFIPDTPSRKKL